MPDDNTFTLEDWKELSEENECMLDNLVAQNRQTIEELGLSGVPDAGSLKNDEAWGCTHILKKEILRLREEAAAFSADQCHCGYGDTGGDHRCKYQDTIEILEAKIQDVSLARRTKTIGITGGGNPARWYDTYAVDDALVGVGPQSELLKQKIQRRNFPNDPGKH